MFVDNNDFGINILTKVAIPLKRNKITTTTTTTTTTAFYFTLGKFSRELKLVAFAELQIAVISSILTT